MHYLPAALLAFLSILSQVFGGKVLVYPSDGSHWVNMKVLIEELHTRGHYVTVLRASNSWYIKEESPFYTSITVYNSGGIEKELLDAFTKHILVIRREKLSFWTHLSLASEVGTNDLLGHPQTKVFITHRGTNGIQEAIYHGVPILGLPIVFDQPDNLSRMKVRGTAKLVDIAELNRTMFLQALEEVLYNPSYKENMQRLSKLHHDQPMKPLDRAVFWIEFVMRNRGAPHLRTQSFRMSWIDRCYFDSADDSCFVLFCFMIHKIIKFLCFKVVFKKKIKVSD
uniref:Uncharacterized protein n=1 Tax=Sinocyclocheilus rhinocerous TaxID=307959 RepID=A0A673GL60_9TELE